MMSKWWLSSALLLVLFSRPAQAQPLFRSDRNWTFSAGEYVFGLREVIMTPGEKRWTQVWLGRCSFDIRCRAAEFIPLALSSLTKFTPRFWSLIEWRSFRCLP
jgi:hypothetical protein